MVDTETTFRGIGIDALQERVYEALIAAPGVGAAEIARTVGRAPRAVAQALDGLETLGFASHAPGRSRRYIPVPPEIAVEALIAARQEELVQARLWSAELQDRFREQPPRAAPSEAVEVVQGRTAIAQRFQAMQTMAREELLVFDRPPYYLSPGQNTRPEARLLAQGVRVKGVYDRDALQSPGQPAALTRSLGEGEEARIVDRLPTKLAIVDRRLAMIHFRLEGETGSSLLLRPSPLLDAIVALFDAVWRRALPLNLADDQTVAPPGAPTLDNEIVLLLAAGLKDQAIAHQLGVSLRTVTRRIGRLIESVGADTRFQAGMRIALNTPVPRVSLSGTALRPDSSSEG